MKKIGCREKSNLIISNNIIAAKLTTNVRKYMYLTDRNEASIPKFYLFLLTSFFKFFQVFNKSFAG